MNIKQAKEYIKDTVSLYLKKDEFGEYRVPIVRQRPVFLLGAPGIGKTAIMEQIASELGVALVSYSMTHHTRQSALGLPFITEKEYGGKKYSVSEYTMSEIIASVYETMEESGIKEGILFLDEINCVSETLSPSMLQFLQYKTFGKHRVPEGWVIVTAGNPPEFNKSVREFDVVTMDRLKLIEVTADYKVWKEYALERGLHPAITSYLDLKKDQFYLMEMTVKGRNYVTARGWEDLSQILMLYEEEGKTPGTELIEQYIRNEKVAREFSAYYELYNKYKRDYHIDEILTGDYPDIVVEKAKKAAFDERLSLMGMLLDRVMGDIRNVMEDVTYIKETKAPLEGIRAMSEDDKKTSDDMIKRVKELSEIKRDQVSKKQRAGALSDREKRIGLKEVRFLEKLSAKLANEGSNDKAAAFESVKASYGKEIEKLKKKTDETKDELHKLFVFVEDAFGEENEMLILMTELTVHSGSSSFIATFGSEDYIKHNKGLMISERGNDLSEAIDKLEL